MDDSASDSSDNVQNESYVEAVTQKRKNMETEKEPPVVSETIVLYQRSVVSDFWCFTSCYFISEEICSEAILRFMSSVFKWCLLDNLRCVVFLLPFFAKKYKWVTVDCWGFL